MKRNRFHRGMALLLAVCMMLTMNGGFAFAAAAPLPAEASITETTESTESPEASDEATAADDEQEEPADPMGSASEGVPPSLDTPVCTCNPAPGTSSVEGHGADCPLYEEPEPPADEQGECTCPPVDSGEIVHGEDCPLYVAPAEPICLCQPVVEDDGTHTNPDCPLYVVQELPLCTCPEGVVEQFEMHLSDCPLYDGPSEEDYTQEFIIEPDEHMPIETVGEAQTKAARSALAAAPAGQTFMFDKGKSGNLSFARFEEKMPNRPIELVFNIDNFSASSNNILALYLTADVGATFYAELNGTSIGGKQSMTSATKLMLAVPFSTSLLHNGENTVKLRFEGLGDLKCRDARILLSGGAQSDKITKAFELQGFSAAYPASELTLRSEVSGVNGQVGFQYIGGANYKKVRSNNVNGSKSFTDTVEFLNTSGLQCQLFVNDGTNYVAYRTKVYQLNYDGVMDWLAVASEIGPQVPAAEEKPTYRTVTVTPNPANSQIVVTGCTVAGENQPSHTATVTKNAENYTFDWGYDDRPDVTLTYTGMGGGTQVYQVPYWSIDLTPPTFNAKAISLLTKSTPVQLEALLRAGVSNYYDEQTPAPDAITIDISKVNLTLAGDYTATITAKDGVGNTTTKDVAVKVENPPVAITKPTANPSGDDASTSRTFSAGITEPGGQVFTERGFVLGFGPAPTVESCVKKIVAPSGTDASFTADEGGLLANVQYYVRTFATNVKGEAYYSDALAFSCGAPGDYGALTADDVLAEIQTGQTSVTATVTVKRTAGGIGSVTLNYGVVPGTLTSVSASNGKLTFAAGETAKTIPIPITDAAAFNEIKSFQVKLTNPTPTTINGSESASVTVGYSTANKTKLDPPGASSGCLLPSGVYNDSRVNDVAIFPHGGYLKNLPTQTITIPGIPTPYEKRGSIPMVQSLMPANWRFEEGGDYTAPFITNGATPAAPSQFHSDNPETMMMISNTVALTATVDVSGCRGHAYAAGFQTDSTQGIPDIEVRFFDGSSNMIDAPTGTTTFTRKVGYDYLVEYPCVDAVERLCSCTGADVVTAGAMGSSDRTIPSNAQTAEVTFRIVDGYKKLLYNFYFGTKEMPQLSFTRFDTDIAAGRTYYPGDQIRIYPVLNSAIEPPTSADTVLVNGAAAAYVPAQKAFVYTIPATGATGSLIVTHNGVTYTVQDETSGAAWSKATPIDAAGTFSYTLGGMPSIAIAGATTGQNTAHSATVTATGGTAYYVWAASATPPSGGWTQIPTDGKISGSGYATAMYLHAKVTNVDGKTVYANQPFTFVAPSVFEVDASPSGWQKAATVVTLTRTPATGATLTVKVSRGGGAAEEVTGTSYSIPESGVYTFTATDTYGFSKTVVRSYSIDAVAPTITVNADSYTENYLYQQLAGITATAKDTGGSELNALEYAWSTSATAPANGFAAVPSNGVIPTQSTDGTWYLHLKATDKAGNESAEQKGHYLVAATAPAPPTVTVTRAENTGSYTVSQGDNTLSMIIAPDKEGYAATPISGSFNITKNGRYTVIAYDSQGIRADASVIVNDIDTDAPNIESSVWNGASEVVYGTYVNADKLTVKVRVDDKLTPTYDANGDITDYFGTGATSFSWKKSGGGDQSVNLSGENGSFEVTENGTYEITAADAQGNPTTERVLVKSIDKTAPALTVTGAVPNPDTWYQAEQTVSFTAADADSGVASVTLQKNSETANPLTAASGTYSAVTSGSGSYTITATDNVGLTATRTFTVKIDTVPVVKISAKTAGGADYTAGTTATGPVTLTISNAAIGSAVTKYEWKLAGESVWKTLALSDPTTTFEKSGTYNCVFHMTNTKGVSAEESFSVVIDLPDITGITVTPYTGVYDGEEHPIVTVTGTQAGDKVYYTIPSGVPTETVPMVTTVADSKSVMVKVTRVNHEDFVSGWNAATVTPRVVAVEFTVPENLVYDGTDKTVTAAITNKCGADDLSLTLGNATGKAVGKYITTVTALSGTAAGNYKLPSSAPSVAWEITGTPYPGEIILPTASGITYGQKLGDSTLTGDNGGTGVFTWNDGAILPPSGDYTATVVFTPNDQNFAPVTRTVQVAVAKADVTLEVSGTKAYHTPPIANADFVVSNITGMVNGETDAALLGTLTLTSDGNTEAAIVGSYDISVAQSGESNYTVTTQTVTDGFTVTRAAQTLSGTASYTKLLTDKDFALDVKTDSTDTDAAVTYTLTNDGGGAVTLDADGKTVRMKKPGTATITANAAETANFSAANPLTITVTIGSMPSVRALATEDITTTEAKIGGVVTVGTIATTGYGLEYKKVSDTDYTPVSADETATEDAKTLTHTLAGLEKDTEYTVRVWAKTADKTFESVTRFRTAAEQPPTGKVEGEITDNSGTKTAITVTIEAGNTVIASHTVNAGGGKFTFEALPDGFYNLVADNGKYKVTRMVEIVKGGAVTNVKMEIGRTQSVVEIVTPDTPNVAVDGLPELFQNDTLFTDDNKAVITAGGTVEFKLTVEKKDTPTDAGKIDAIAEGKVGVYLDIGLRKTVIDQNGREQESELVPDLGANEITIVIPLPKELQGKQSYTVYRVHDGAAEKLESDYSAEQNTLTIKSSLFSTYAIAYTEKSGGGGGGSGGGSSHDDDNYDFWQKVKDKIGSAEDGDTVKAGAGSYDKMPESVMDALRKNPGVTLEITWRGGDKITIPAGEALERDGLRIFYPLSYLEELFRGIAAGELPDNAKTNPETGGVWEINAPVTAAQLPVTTTPKDDGTAATPEQADTARAAIEPPATPEIATIPDIAEVADSAPSRNRAVLFTGLVIMLAAAAVACGVVFWKKKQEDK